MKKLTIILTLLFSASLYANANGIIKKDWHQGIIVLNDGSTLEGKIQYDLSQNVAIFKKKDKMKAFSVYDVDHFRFMDKKRRTLRRFYSMPYQLESGQQRLMFFELIFHDNFALFNREKKIRKEQAALSELPFIDEEDNDMEQVKVFTYYVFTPDGEFKKIYTEENDLARKLSLNRDQRKDMQRFIYENNLNLNNRSDFIRVIYEFV